MSELTKKFVALKTAIGGNREVMHYEDTFGMPREEVQHITPPPAYLRRLLGELEFALRLNEAENNRFENELARVLTILLKKQREEGALLRTDVTEAEKILAPLGKVAKTYTLILAGHAHIDMNWMWSWHETVAATLATFNTMINIMEEYPDFCFSQSQGAVYEIVEKFDPALAEKIRGKIEEGRWEVTASAWVETDKNMPNTESLARHIAYTKNYMKEHWGVEPDRLEVDFSPDTFGHSACLPEIDRLGGVKYYYHCRALDGDYVLYRWRAPSGQELLCYREPYWYNAAITPKIGAGLMDLVKRSAGLKTGLVVYGVGDHGGGPTRRDVERALDMMTWPVFPTLKFGTFHEFFHAAESVRESLPVVERELNYFAPGCYTTQSRLKMANRAGERALLSADAMKALAAVYGGATGMKDSLEQDWHGLLFTHFHDILTGSCVQDSREHAMGLYSETLAAAQSAFGIAARKLTDAIDTSGILVREQDRDSQAEGAGGGYGIPSFSSAMPRPERGNGLTRLFTVINTTPVPKNEGVEITVWDWVGDMRYLKVTDTAGEALPFQKLDHSLQTYWDHKYFRVLVQVNVAAYGYTTLVLDEGEREGSYPLYYQGDTRTNARDLSDYVLENDRIRATFAYGSGELLSLYAKKEGKEMLASGKTGGLRLVDTERATSNAWCIGNYLKVTPVDTALRSTGTLSGPIRQGFYVEYKLRSSTLRMNVTLDRGDPWFRVSLDVDWHEVGGDTVPVLIYELPLADAGEFRYDVPAGSVVRPPLNHDVPGLQYGAGLTAAGDLAVAILQESKYGYRGTHDGRLITTLINSATSPDPYPERGMHTIRFAVGVLPPLAKTLEDAATSANNALTYQAVTSHKGTLPSTGNLLGFASASTVISSLEMTPQGLRVRMYNTAKETDNGRISFTKEIREACFTDLLDRPLTRENVAIRGNTVSFPVPPFGLVNLLITL